MREGAEAEGSAFLEAPGLPGCSERKPEAREQGRLWQQQEPIPQVLWVQSKDFALFPECNGKLPGNFKQRSIMLMLVLF